MMARMESRVACSTSAWPISAPLASAFALILSPTTFSTWAQLPSSAETSSPLAWIGQFGFSQDGALGRLLDSLLVVLQRAEESLPLGIDRGGILLVAGVESSI